MTEQHDNTTTTQNEAVPSADGLSAPPEGEGTGQQENGSQSPDPIKGLTEARDRYRSERDALAERVQRMQRVEIERLAGEHLSMGADLFINGNAVSDYLTADGDVDANKVAADVAAVIAERPGLRKATFFDPSQGRGGRPPQAPRLPTAADLFRRN